MAKKITTPQVERYWLLRREGFTQLRSAKEAGFSLSHAKRLEGQPANGQEIRAQRLALQVPDTPIPLEDLCADAKAALGDRTGNLFALRYAGFELSTFQQNLWSELEDAYDTEDREFLCLNGPPGLGKSTVFVLFGAKRTAMDRSIRGLFISRASSLAERHTTRLRRLLERTTPAIGAAATLSADYGRFKPKVNDVWQRAQFVVEQMDGTPIEEKEPTWSAFGFDAEWLGNRLNLIFGDDLDSTRSLQNMDTIATNRDIFDNELEPRLEPRGLLALGQQRLGPFDFSSHALSKRILPEDDGSGDEVDGTAQYRHVTYKAHYDELCRGAETHKTGAPAWPDGCLLDPRRLSWRDVRKAQNNPQRFAVVYQQEDTTASDALVQKIWVDGGTDRDGEVFIGCWDKDRGLWELPHAADGTNTLVGETIGIITVDPSASRFWSVQAWVYHPDSQQRFLLDLHRERMGANDFLDWSPSLNAFTGIAEDWWHNYQRLGVNLSHVIVETNSAQRYMLQYEFFHRWMRLRNVQVIGHQTQRQKLDPLFGIQMLAPVWRSGRVRLPAKPGSRHISMRLVDEVLRYPNVHYTDCTMGQWFLECNLDKVYVPGIDSSVAQWRPSWLVRDRGAA